MQHLSEKVTAEQKNLNLQSKSDVLDISSVNLFDSRLARNESNNQQKLKNLIEENSNLNESNSISQAS